MDTNEIPLQIQTIANQLTVYNILAGSIRLPCRTCIDWSIETVRISYGVIPVQWVPVGNYGFVNFEKIYPANVD